MSRAVIEHEPGFKPIQPPRRSVPYHYIQGTAVQAPRPHEKDMDPTEPIYCVLNVVFTDKKTPGEIRMNIDTTPINKGAKITKHHIKTAAEVQQELEGTVYFSELDMGTQKVMTQKL